MSGSECVAKVAWRRIWVELTRWRCRREWPLFARRRRLEWTGVDVKLPPTVARMDVAIGRRARLQGTPREGVNRRHELTPPQPIISIFYRADRHRDPALNDNRPSRQSWRPVRPPAPAW